MNRNDFADLFPLWKQAFAGNFGKAIVDIVPPPAYLSTAAFVVPMLAKQKGARRERLLLGFIFPTLLSSE